LKALASALQRLIAGREPDGFNIGFTDGLAAGQTVLHAHVHVIPRRHGDVPDPRGGIGWVITDKAPYWKK
jgi:diadenosine tetraphosphate (Ap4A) HIT family hydrolase